MKVKLQWRKGEFVPVYHFRIAAASQVTRWMNLNIGEWGKDWSWWIKDYRSGFIEGVKVYSQKDATAVALFIK